MPSTEVSKGFVPSYVNTFGVSVSVHPGGFAISRCSVPVAR
jgi:hypothetical protein